MTDAARQAAIETALTAIFRHEGTGFTDRPHDRGGPTNGGVTLKLLRYLRPGATVDDLKALTDKDRRDIFQLEFIEQPKIDTLPPELIPQIADMAVLHGPSNAIEMLQKVISTTGDGIIGPNTTAHARILVRAVGGYRLNDELAVRRIHFMANIVTHDDTQREFLLGWINRALSFVVL